MPTCWSSAASSQEAIGQFLRLVEQDWANVAGHRRLAELALQIAGLPDRRDPCRAAPTSSTRTTPRIRAYKATVDYHDGKHEAAVAMARGVLEEAPGNLTGPAWC